MPLLFEAGMDRGYDATIAVVADEEVRARAGRRARPRGGRRAHRAQLTQDEKAARATYVVRNDGSVEELEPSCPTSWTRLTASP